LSLVSDKVVNVRIGVARALRNHFKTINGAFVNDVLVNNAIRCLRHDKDNEVIMLVTEIQTYQDFNDASSQSSNASANTEMSTEFFMQSLNQSRRDSHSTDGETSQMEEEIIKTSGIMLSKANEKLVKPEVVKIDPNQKFERRDRFIEGTEEDLTSLEPENFNPDDDAALAEQLQDDDPFSNLESAEA